MFMSFWIRYSSNLFSIVECVAVYGEDDMDESMLCIREVDHKGGGICGIDFGGAFFQTVGNEPIVAGIGSFGSKNCGKYPAVFTRIQWYLTFINDVMNGVETFQKCTDIEAQTPVPLGG